MKTDPNSKDLECVTFAEVESSLKLISVTKTEFVCEFHFLMSKIYKEWLKTHHCRPDLGSRKNRTSPWFQFQLEFSAEK